MFASAEDGWRLDLAPYSVTDDDRGLSAGPGNQVSAWPATNVQATHDGGKTWVNVYHQSNGVWSVDLLTPSVGWIAGVTGLLRTTDGGRTFRPLAEPAGNPLVRVQFTSPTTGIGVQTDGGTVISRDGGRSWQASEVGQKVIALCASRTGAAYAVTAKGDLLGFPRIGSKPSDIRRAPAGTIPSDLWASLECEDGGGYSMSLMQSEGNQVGYPNHWTVTGASPTSSAQLVGAAGVFANGSVSQLVETLFISSRTSSGGSIALGAFTTDNSAIGSPFGRVSIAHRSTQAQEFVATTYDNLAGFPPPDAQSVTQFFTGATALANDVWTYATADAYLPSSGSRMYINAVLHSSDGGATWALVNVTTPRKSPSLADAIPH